MKLIGEDVTALEPGSCSSEALTTRRPVFVGSLTDAQDKFWHSASLAADNGFTSTAALPLVVEGAPIGVLGLLLQRPGELR